ncbi:MAG: ATP-binding protein [Gordonia paraffinivorans]
MTEPVMCTPDELRELFLFEHLSDDQLDTLCREGHVVEIEPGPLYTEGEPATCFYVLVSGEVVMSKMSAGEDIQISRTSQKGVYAGAWQAYLGDLGSDTYPASMRAVIRSRFFVLDADVFGRLVREWFPMAVHLLEGLFIGNQNSRQVLDQRERLLALGSLSAGLTHELNNPAAAAVRATSALRDRVSHMRRKLQVIASGTYDAEAIATLIRLQDEAAELVAKAPTLTPLEAADREDAIADWLDDHSITQSWELASPFVAAGIDVDWLEKIAARVDTSILESAVRWLFYTVETELLMNEIGDSTTRVSTLVDAARQYSQMDRAPHQRADLRELIDSTLIMLGRKIGDGVTVVREYDPTLPALPVYAAELNQVWTNLIDNAVAAMGGTGTLTVRTRRDDDDAVVEIADTGPGVPEDIRTRIFEPFFTTKAVGEGTGLGLDISWRIVVKKHHGSLTVRSEPGDTVFEVRIPLETPVLDAPPATD